MKDRTLVIILAFFTIFVIAFHIVLSLIPEETLLPGGPPLYLLSVVGSILALGAMFYFFTRRTSTFADWKQPWVDRHIIFGSLAVAILFVHAAGNLTKAPTLMLLAMVGLFVTGAFGRLFAPRGVALRFAQDIQAFAPIPEGSAASLQAVIDKKTSLLPALSADVPEGQFSLTLSHWFRQPRTALRYLNLSLKEARLVQAQRETAGGLLPLLQQYWRPLHQVCVLLLFLGMISHLVTVSFFADYAAAATGREINWWHFR